MSGARIGGMWLIGLGVGSVIAAAARGSLSNLAVPFLLGAVGFLFLTRLGRTSQRFPGTDLERGLDRLFALLLPAPGAATTATARRAALKQQLRLVGLRRAARRWGKELQLITTDGYETASRISARGLPRGEQDDQALVAEAVRVLREERAAAGADMALGDDLVSMLAYGLGARPAAADLTSLEDLLYELGLSEDGDELRTHFDEIVATESRSTDLHLRNEAQRSMFRDLAGASFVLGAAARILELVSLAPARDLPAQAGAAG